MSKMEDTQEGTLYHYEYSDEKSNKFWEIILEEKSFTVSYGRIGNKAQSKTKEWSSPEEALKQANKIRESKEKKGYYFIH